MMVRSYSPLVVVVLITLLSGATRLRLPQVVYAAEPDKDAQILMLRKQLAETRIRALQLEFDKVQDEYREIIKALGDLPAKQQAGMEAKEKVKKEGGKK